MVQALAPFAPLFSKRVWQHAQLLVVGAILAPGKRTVASALRAMGLDQEKRFHRYHRVLSRASWSSLKVSRIFFDLLVEAFVSEPRTVWEPTTIANWYGSAERTVEIVSATAGWYSTGLPAVPVRWVLVRDPEGDFKTQALLCTNLNADPRKVLSWFVMRWQLEVTFQEARRHLGFETQRQWSEMAIRRTTPALLGLFSLIALLVDRQMTQAVGVIRQAAWYHKRDPTFSDALALVRKELWAHATFCGSRAQTDTVKVPRTFVERLTEALCYAA